MKPHPTIAARNTVASATLEQRNLIDQIRSAELGRIGIVSHLDRGQVVESTGVLPGEVGLPEETVLALIADLRRRRRVVLMDQHETLSHPANLRQRAREILGMDVDQDAMGEDQ